MLFITSRCSIKKQLKNTIFLLTSSSLVKFSNSRKSSLTNNPIYLIPRTLIVRTLTLKLSFFLTSFSDTKNLNISFYSSHVAALTARSLFSISSPRVEVEINRQASSSSDVNCSSIKSEDLLASSIPVRAYFLCNSIDLRGLMAENQVNLIPHTSEMNNYVVLRFRNRNSHTPPDLEGNLSGSSYSYMVVFMYGSVVMFNILDHEVDRYLKIILRHCSGSLQEMRKDGGVSFQNCINYEVRENPNSPTWMQGGIGYIVLQRLDTRGISMIGCVLGQSIALDYYVHKVDEVFVGFSELYTRRKKIGSYITRNKKMHRLVGKANSYLAYIILHLGLFERSDIAWKEDPNYSQTLDYLRNQFNLAQIFIGLDFYLILMERFIIFVGSNVLFKYFHSTFNIVNGCFAYVFSLSPAGRGLFEALENLVAVIDATGCHYY